MDNVSIRHVETFEVLSVSILFYNKNIEADRYLSGLNSSQSRRDRARFL